MADKSEQDRTAASIPATSVPLVSEISQHSAAFDAATERYNAASKNYSKAVSSVKSDFSQWRSGGKYPEEIYRCAEKMTWENCVSTLNTMELIFKQSLENTTDPRDKLAYSNALVQITADRNTILKLENEEKLAHDDSLKAKEDLRIAERSVLHTNDKLINLKQSSATHTEVPHSTMQSALAKSPHASEIKWEPQKPKLDDYAQTRSLRDPREQLGRKLACSHLGNDIVTVSVSPLNLNSAEQYQLVNAVSTWIHQGMNKALIEQRDGRWQQGQDNYQYTPCIPYIENDKLRYHVLETLATTQPETFEKFCVMVQAAREHEETSEQVCALEAMADTIQTIRAAKSNDLQP